MKKTFLSLMGLMGFCGWVVAQIAPEELMKMESPDFSEGATVPKEMTCEGANIAPTLRFIGIPTAAKSLVLIMEDPDTAKGTLTHWTIWNIPPDRVEITKGAVPPTAVQGRNDMGKNEYVGPCPPSGEHRYYFKLYALNTTLNLPASANRKMLEEAMKGRILMEASLMGKYAKQDTDVVR